MVVESDCPQHIERISFADSRWSRATVVSAIVILCGIRALALVPRTALNEPLRTWYGTVLGVLLYAVVILLPLALREPRGWRSLALPSRRECLREFLIAVPLVALNLLWMACAAQAILHFAPGTNLTPDTTYQIASSSKSIMFYPILIYAFTLAPLFEETFFRGFLFNALRVRINATAAILIASALFALVHFYSPVQSLLVTGIGIFLNLVYRWRKTLLTPIFVHAGHNFLMMIGVLYLSGTLTADGPILGVVAVPEERGYRVESVLPRSAADEAHLLPGDLIVAVDGTSLTGGVHLIEVIRRYTPGDRIRLHILRNDAPLEVDAVLKRRGSP